MSRHEVLFVETNGNATLTQAARASGRQHYHLPYFVERDREAKVRALLSEIDKIYAEFADNHHIPGYAFGIMLDGQLAHSGAGGFASLAPKIPATPRTMFRIASMTKSFTAMAILKLRDEQKLRLDDPVSRFIPEMQGQRLTQDAPELTIRDLLTHSSGLPTDDPWADRKLGETQAEFIALLKKGLYFSNAAGAAYEYSNLGYTMLGGIIQTAAGIPYNQFILEHICQPIGMLDIAWDIRSIKPQQLARGYRWNEEWKEQEMLPDGVFGAMGGLIASVESFSRYAALHQSAWPPRHDPEAGPIKRSTLREMHQPWRFTDLTIEKLPDGRDRVLTSAYGYGLRWSRDNLGRVFVGHSGGLPGFGSNWFILPEYGLGVILLSNATYAPASKANLDMLDLLVRKAGLMPRQLHPADIMLDRQKALVKCLPDWEKAAESGIFAGNFFLDHALEDLRSQTKQHFSKAGKILSVEEVIPDNQLQGSFIMRGEINDIRVSFGLTPENPPLIQICKVQECPKCSI